MRAGTQLPAQRDCVHGAARAAGQAVVCQALWARQGGAPHGADTGCHIVTAGCCCCCFGFAAVIAARFFFNLTIFSSHDSSSSKVATGCGRGGVYENGVLQTYQKSKLSIFTPLTYWWRGGRFGQDVDAEIAALGSF